jgi:Fe-S-cluster containining protein
MPTRFDVILRKVKLEIPPFKGCKRCGQCCGPLKCHPLEWEKIKAFLNHNGLWEDVAENCHNHKAIAGKLPVKSCFLLGFESDGTTYCMIYKVRPIVCRMQGLKPELQCKMSQNESFKTTKHIDRYYQEIRVDGVILNDEIQKMVMFHLSTKMFARQVMADKMEMK